ncbi:MAG TPA: hypothetical protein VFX17_00590 [Patescibacteria group bacterium]|nr:hypothetical protein [Patescibacteria group bacterium]
MQQVHYFHSRKLMEALEFARKSGFPVRLAPACAYGGWVKLADNEEEFKTLFKKAARRSPGNEVEVQILA